MINHSMASVFCLEEGAACMENTGRLTGIKSKFSVAEKQKADKRRR
jgi:hypothetical protein